jgi:alpha-beta hydrolase superfamily lysophospholipase
VIHLNRAARLAGKTALWLAVILAAVMGTIVIGFAVQARVNLAELRPWHRVRLVEEFRADRIDAPKSFDEYRSLEDRLLAELRRRVLDDPAARDNYMLGRFNPQSIPSRLALETPYNRSFELVPDAIRGAVLLVHGLTDSPYALRGLAEFFRERGFYVVVLRMPGHGTLPAGLVAARWQDWYAAVELAARHAAARAGPGKPFYAGGYSTGAALVTLYAVRSLGDASLPRTQRLVLLSPAIGMSEFAVLTNIIAGLAFIPYFEKSRWLDVWPEYDPYKYNSFPVNATNQIHLLTRELHRSLDAAAARGQLEAMPRVLAFQSLVDATITAGDVVRRLLGRFPAAGHELVVFDINRAAHLGGLIATGPREDLERIRNAPELPFRFTLVANRSSDTDEVVAYTRNAGDREASTAEIGLRWPRGVLSLGHVALPFPPDDPVYGLEPRSHDGPPFTLGNLAPRGESGSWVVPLGTFARLRSNPFFAMVKMRIAAFIDSE